MVHCEANFVTKNLLCKYLCQSFSANCANIGNTQKGKGKLTEMFQIKLFELLVIAIRLHCVIFFMYLIRWLMRWMKKWLSSDWLRCSFQVIPCREIANWISCTNCKLEFCYSCLFFPKCTRNYVITYTLKDVLFRSGYIFFVRINVVFCSCARQKKVFKVNDFFSAKI